MNPTFIVIIIVAVIIILCMAIALRILSSRKTNKNDIKEINETMPYKLVDSIFTKSERELFEILEKISKDKNLILLSKVRMADITKIENSNKNFQYWFNKIRSKHVDFLLCKREDGKPKIAIELDDYTHNQKNRKERDEFVNEVYKKIELPILHITEINKKKIEDEIENSMKV